MRETRSPRYNVGGDSEPWRSTWPGAAVFPVPSLLSGPSAKPPGIPPIRPFPFRPSLPALSSLLPPSPAPRHGASTPPPSATATAASFGIPVRTSSPDPTRWASSPPSSRTRRRRAEDPAFPKRLHVLRCRHGAAFVLFFLTGWDADEVGYLCLLVRDGEPESVAEDGTAFRQRVGFVHAHHRITGMSANPADPLDVGWGAPVDPTAEGYLLVTTFYSVNWYRVVFGVAGSDSGRGMPSLFPVGRRSFGSKVAHACWNPHFQEESVVLLENGDLYWMKLNSKRGVVIKAPEGEALPWILFVASSNAVVMVDLRSKKWLKANDVGQDGGTEFIHDCPFDGERHRWRKTV
ncbi:hypothetical protein Taro_018077 [Colocasia esculenta]|uniref:Uncharacterized protein n=1 Tax=Colocasia esculenta TaxID=4460 RepID=A0A843UT06_COLES|nr:hypothetical protein [Colocasia esculenta]